MRVVLAPDSFGGTLTAVEAAGAMAAGWRTAVPDVDIDVAPISDGGPGFVDVLSASLGGELRSLAVTGPLGDRVTASFLLAGDTAYVESAQACGLHLVPPDRRQPRWTTTYGVGELLGAALDAGARQVVIGLGGSSTNDGGAGMLAALGLALLGEGRRGLPPGGGALAGLERAEVAGLDSRLGSVDLVAATDVDNPLLGPTGATATYGPQKGATAADVQALDAALARFAEVLGRALPRAAELVEAPGAGAAGGLGYAMLALGARRESGIGLVLRHTRLPERIAAAGLVVTGEGSFDWQSLRGKAVSGVAAAAAAAGLPCLVLAGRVSVGRREMAAAGVSAAYSLAESAGSELAARTRAADELQALAARVAVQWSRRG